MARGIEESINVSAIVGRAVIADEDLGEFKDEDGEFLEAIPAERIMGKLTMPGTSDRLLAPPLGLICQHDLPDDP